VLQRGRREANGVHYTKWPALSDQDRQVLGPCSDQHVEAQAFARAAQTRRLQRNRLHECGEADGPQVAQLVACKHSAPASRRCQRQAESSRSVKSKKKGGSKNTASPVVNGKSGKSNKSSLKGGSGSGSHSRNEQQVPLNEMPIYSQVQKNGSGTNNNTAGGGSNKNLVISNGGQTNADSWV